MTRGWVAQSILALLLGIVSSVIPPDAPAATDNGSAIIAKGDHGFLVTQQDVETLSRFIEDHMSFETTPEAFQGYAVQVFLFAKEARRRGLQVPESFQPVAPVHGEMVLAEAYLDQILRDYVLDPLVIESYYKAHFEDYVIKVEALQTKNMIREDALVPLESSKEDIRKTLLALVRQRVAKETFHRLISEYNVTGDFSHGR